MSTFSRKVNKFHSPGQLGEKQMPRT